MDERLMGTVDQFIYEMNLIKPKSLKELNDAFYSLLDEGYYHKPLSALKGLSPAIVFAEDARILRFATPE